MLLVAVCPPLRAFSGHSGPLGYFWGPKQSKRGAKIRSLILGTHSATNGCQLVPQSWPVGWHLGADLGVYRPPGGPNSLKEVLKIRNLIWGTHFVTNGRQLAPKVGLWGGT